NLQESTASRVSYFASLARLLFELEPLGQDVFRSVLLPSDSQMWQGTKRAIFGGQVAAQCLSAAYRTVPQDRFCHSLHSYFIAAGDKTKPVEFRVRRVRDGRSYSSRSIEGVQDDRAIFTMIASFSLPEGDVVHINHPMPKVPPAESLDVIGFLTAAANLPALDQSSSADKRESEPDLYRQFVLPHLRKNEELSSELRSNAQSQLDMYSRLSLEIQPTDPLVYYRVRPADEPKVHMWLRARDAPPPEPADASSVGTAAASGSSPAMSPTAVRQSHVLTTYMADMGILRGGLVSDLSLQAAFVTSLDHSVYFHEPLLPHEFVLYEAHCLFGGRGRTTNKGNMWRRDGALVATVFQEGLVRLVSQPPSAI
uniref:Acyl-CoA thioesterase II n=1 Tax=Macrostomum lignano TaxID=282301 RepID=A0A1I8FZU9_9PLAT